MKVLLTGAAGQVGSEVLALSDAEFQVRPFTRSELDIGRADDVRRCLDATKPDILVNCAAYTAVDRAEDESELAHAVNADALSHIGAACAERHIGVIHLSTDYVFDGRKDSAYVEDDRPNPLSVYGKTKLAGEERLREACSRHVILRVSWVFGRVGRSFVDTMLGLGAERDELTVVDDQVGTPMPASFIADATRRIARVIEMDDGPWGTVHLATKPAVSWCAFARRILDEALAAGQLRSAPPVHPIRTADWPAKATRPLNSQLDAKRAAAWFGLEPQPWQPALRDYIGSLNTA